MFKLNVDLNKTKSINETCVNKVPSKFKNILFENIYEKKLHISDEKYYIIKVYCVHTCII